LSLLNTTVSQLAKAVNQVLTIAYRDLYGEEESEQPTSLSLLTAPLAASEEVVQLFQAGLAPIEIAMPACLHAIGASKDEIDLAVKEAVEKKEKDCACEDEEKKLSNQRSAVDLEAAKANVAATKAQTATAAREAKQPVEKKAAASSSKD